MKVDKTPPVTSARINGAAPVASYTGAARVALTRDDGDGSGAVATEYRIGAAGPWTPYTGAFDLTQVGGYRVDFRSRDLVGNTENFKTLLLRVAAAVAPAGDPPAAPDPAPFAALEPVERRLATKRALRRGDLRCASRARTSSRGLCSCGCRARSRSASGWAAGCWRSAACAAAAAPGRR